MIDCYSQVLPPSLLGGGFKYFLFSPLVGEMTHFDQYFSKGLKPPPSFFFLGGKIFRCFKVFTAGSV